MVIGRATAPTCAAALSFAALLDQGLDVRCSSVGMTAILGRF